MAPVFKLTLRQLTGRWRLAIMAVLAALPVVFTTLALRSSEALWVTRYEDIVVSTLLTGSIGPLIILAIASVAFGNEIDDRTLANLTLTPLPRWKIVLPKFLASVVVAAPFILGSAFFTSWIGFNHDVEATGAIVGSLAVGLLMYSAAFLWLGLVVEHAIGIGLLYILLWEGFFSGYVSGIRFFSLRGYTVAWMNGLDPRRFVESAHVGLTPAIVVAVAVVLGFLWLAIRRLRRMDVP